ncbi:MAG TPA: FkbM family methyltransferase [Saprospiraceae bacterium]|nr:FkbM family methyltransferase [Saprospiraceae bacterium]
MKKILYRLANLAYLLLKTRNPLHAFRFYHFKTEPLFYVSWQINSKGLFFPDVPLLLPHSFCRRCGYDLNELCRLARNPYLRAIEQTDEVPVLWMQYRGEDIRFQCRSIDNLMVVNELFTDKIYEFEMGCPLVCIDIGMNAGLSTLLLAARADVQRIYAYEPFRSTYDLAMSNIAINKTLQAKINPIHAGWSDKEGMFSFHNYEEGSLGASTSFTADLHTYGQTAGTTEVQLLDASSELRRIMQLHPDQSLFVKLDCEGSEYEILEKLSQDGLLPHVHAFLMEWHHKGAAPIEEILKKNGFSFFSTGRPDVAQIGFVYAVNTSNHGV